ncbi:MAG TPA: transposase [Pirellulales bacterium]|jgi:REP element-mobilizing transposase RayT|nr:transposase [Pirellulales bacterium]
MRDFQFFDPRQDVAVAYGNLPHWAQAGTLVFITWRTADSLPAPVLARIAQEKAKLLESFGLDTAENYKAQLAKLPVHERAQVQWAMFETWDRQLDAGAGRCVLKQPELSQIVADSLLHFDGDRYLLTDFVVMPNHVHLLVALATEEALWEQCTSWKRFSGRQINQKLGQTGAFWQVEQFDHLVRNPEQFEHYRRYIAANPPKAHLPEGAYRWFSKDLRSA